MKSLCITCLMAYCHSHRVNLPLIHILKECIMSTIMDGVNEPPTSEQIRARSLVMQEFPMSNVSTLMACVTSVGRLIPQTPYVPTLKPFANIKTRSDLCPDTGGNKVSYNQVAAE